MADILSLKLNNPISSNNVEGSQVSYTGQWHAETDEQMVGDQVVAFAQEAVGNTLPAGAEELPNIGDPFLWNEDHEIETTIPGTGSTADIVAWGNAVAGRWVDPSALALDFVAAPRGTTKTKWTISVTWRTPTPRTLEQPQFLALLNAPDFANISDADPRWINAKEQWVEYVPEPFDGVLGFRVVGGNHTGSFAPMLSTNGEPMPPVPLARMRNILVIQSLVKSYSYASSNNLAFENTVNSAAVVLGDLGSIPKYQARFLRSETSPPQKHRGSTYYTMQTRIEVSTAPYFVNRAAEGSYFLDSGVGNERQVLTDNEGYVLQRIPLTSVGTVASPVELPTNQAVLTHLPFNPVSYAPFAF